METDCNLPHLNYCMKTLDSIVSIINMRSSDYEA